MLHVRAGVLAYRVVILPAIMVVAILGAFLIELTPVSSALPSRPGDPPCSFPNGWVMPIDVTDSTDPESWGRLGWDSFIALAWPQLEGGSPGQPDTSKSICDTPARTPVMVHWVQKEQVFLEDGENPGDWDNLTALAPTYTGSDGRTLPLLGALSKTQDADLITLFHEADIESPLIDQNGRNVLFEIYLNQTEFLYLSQNQYYDQLAQRLAFVPDPPVFKGFPKTGADSEFDPGTGVPTYAKFGATEFKASWKQLTIDEAASGRFLTREVYYASNMTGADPPCGPVTIGLIGLHLLRLTPDSSSTWFWATYEHIDNVSTDLPPPATPLLNPGPDATQCPSPYSDGYTCAQTLCTLPGAPNCPPQPVEDNEGTDVCLANLGWATNISRIPEMEIPPVIANLNAEYQAELPAPWKYYQLINTLQPDANGTCCVQPVATNTVNACYMTNTSMESFTQYWDDGMFPKCAGSTTMSMNCTDCHAAGLPQGAPSDDSGFPVPGPGNPTGQAFQVFTFLLFAAESSCPLDITLDGNIDGADLAYILGNWSTSDDAADLNNDQFVDGADLAMLLGGWGSICP